MTIQKTRALAAAALLAFTAYSAPAKATPISTSAEPTADCSCCLEGKPRVLTMRYLGSDCSATSHTQAPDKVHCAGDPNDDPLVFIRATNSIDPDSATARIWFEGDVLLDSAFDLDSLNANRNHLDSRTFVYVYDTAGGALLQSVEFHTSCSQPLEYANQFGSLWLQNCIGEDAPQSGSVCNDGRPTILTLEYTGSDCSATTHSQAPDKVNCSGDPMNAAGVFIRSTDNEDPNAGGVDVWFEGIVMLNEQYDLDAANAGATRLDARTYVYVYDMAGANLLQSIEFHTSCSQPLFEGNQFGSVLVISAIGENAGGGGNGDCCTNGKPRVLTFNYTGEGCSASNHGQTGSAFDCSGDPGGLSPARIRVSDKGNPTDPNAKVWFDDIVSVGDNYSADAANAGATKLSNTTHIHVFDANGAVIQQLKFHTSCSQPLNMGDNFGGHVLLSCISENEGDPGCVICLGGMGECPCGNDDPAGGCSNSTGLGATLRATGSASVDADDLVLLAEGLPANEMTLFLMARSEGPVSKTVFAGKLCLGGIGNKIIRLLPVQSSGAAGVVTLGPGLVDLSCNGTIVDPAVGCITPGSSWSFQAFYRDANDGCGFFANLTSGLRVTFTP